MLQLLRQLTEIGGTVCGVGGLLILGLLSGVDVWSITIDALSVRIDFFEGVLTVAAFTTVVVVTGLFVVVDTWVDRGSNSVTSGPPARAIVPAYHDAAVVDVSVESLRESDYDPLEITVAVEPDDEATKSRARELAARYDDVECLVSDSPGSKASAINDVVRRRDEEYFAVFDADERVSPDFVPTAMSELLDGTDVFQGRRIPRPTGPVETLAYCERIIVQAGYAGAELFGFTHCQSSSTAFTRDAFASVGGYDDKLTEDIDFSHKCNRAGLSVVQNRRCTNTMEAPHTIQDFWGQRKRWRIGHVQVFDSQVRAALDGEITLDDLTSVGRAASGIVGGAFLLVIAAHVLLLLVQEVESAFLVPYACVLGMIGAIAVKDVAEGRIERPSWSILFVPLVYLGHGVLSVKSFLEFYLTWEGEWYQVAKIGA